MLPETRHDSCYSMGLSVFKCTQLFSEAKKKCSIASENAENCRSRQRHYRLTSLPQGTSANIRIKRIPPENGLRFCCWQYGSIFIPFFWWAPKDASFLKQSAYRPFKVNQGRWFWHQSKGRMQLPILVVNSNFGPILHRFWDTATYWLKIANFSYPTPI